MAAAAIRKYPQAFPEVHRAVRKAVLRRFPYSLLFIIEDERITVVGCFHQRRDPRSWPVQPETEAFIREQKERGGSVELVPMGSSLKIRLVAEGRACATTGSSPRTTGLW